MFVVGIDPGLTGAIGVLGPQGEYVDVYDIPVKKNGAGLAKVLNQIDPHVLAKVIRTITKLGPVFACVEKVSTMPKQGIASNGSLMHSLGTIEGVLGGLGVPYDYAYPAVWKKQYGLSHSAKHKSLSMARALYPEAPLNRAGHHNRAEALLLASYGIAQAKLYRIKQQANI